MLFMGQDINPGVTPTIPAKKADAREFRTATARESVFAGLLVPE